MNTENEYMKSWLVVQNLSIAFSSVFIFFEAFRLTLVKKNRQNEESRETWLYIESRRAEVESRIFPTFYIKPRFSTFFILTVLLDKCRTKSFEEYEHTTEKK